MINPLNTPHTKLKGKLDNLKKEAELFEKYNAHIFTDSTITKDDIDFIQSSMNFINLESNIKDIDNVDLCIKFMAKKLAASFNQAETDKVKLIIKTLESNGVIKRKTWYRCIKKNVLSLLHIVSRLVLG